MMAFILQHTYPQCENLGQDITQVACQDCAFFKLSAKGKIAVPVCSQVELLHPTSFELQFQQTHMGMQYWKNIWLCLFTNSVDAKQLCLEKKLKKKKKDEIWFLIIPRLW